jgi:hypothetical protein
MILLLRSVWPPLLLALLAGAVLPGCGELDDETYVEVMVERLRLSAEEGLVSGEALEEAARRHGTTAREVREYARWLFRDRDADVGVAREIVRRGREYLPAP